MDRINVLGVGVSPLNIPLAVAAMDRAIEHRSKGYICVTGVHGVSEAQTHAGFRSILNGAFLNTPDGMPMVWLGKLAGHKEMDRVYGPDLMRQICRVSGQTGWRHFFYGGAPGVAEQLADSLRAEFPHLQVVGTFTPPYRPLDEGERSALREEVARTRPDIIWVGLSTPKQETFMAEALAGWTLRLWSGSARLSISSAGACARLPAGCSAPASSGFTGSSRNRAGFGAVTSKIIRSSPEGFSCNNWVFVVIPWTAPVDFPTPFFS